eukprot:3769891-Rhodomonas_salina.3
MPFQGVQLIFEKSISAIGAHPVPKHGAARSPVLSFTTAFSCFLAAWRARAGATWQKQIAIPCAGAQKHAGLLLLCRL